MSGIVEHLRDYDGPDGTYEMIYDAADAIEFLVAELKFARDAVDDWAAYASGYFREKWDLEGDLQRIDAAIARFETSGSAGRLVGGGDAAAHPTNHTAKDGGGE